jgi:hypothetical protein
MNEDEFKPVSFVDEGQEVLCFIKGRRVLCKVEAAMGDTARVVNPLLHIDTWVAVNELLARRSA